MESVVLNHARSSYEHPCPSIEKEGKTAIGDVFLYQRKPGESDFIQGIIRHIFSRT